MNENVKKVIEKIAKMTAVEARLYLQSCFEGNPTSQFVALPIAGGLLKNNLPWGDWVHFDAGNIRQKKAAVIDDRMPELLPLSEQEHLTIALAVDAEVISEKEGVVTFEVARRAAEVAAHLIAQQRGWKEYEVDGNPRAQVYRVSAR